MSCWVVVSVGTFCEVIFESCWKIINGRFKHKHSKFKRIHISDRIRKLFFFSLKHKTKQNKQTKKKPKTDRSGFCNDH